MKPEKTKRSISLINATRSKTIALALGLLVNGFLVLQVSAQTSSVSSTDWVRFLGNDGSSSLSEVNVPLEWSADKNLKWKKELPGPGASSPIVIGDRVFLTCYTGYGDKPFEDLKTADKTAGDIKDLTRHLICFDRETGDIVWQKAVDNSTVKNEDPYKSYITYHGYATNTPITDGDSVFAFFGKAGVIRFDMEGNEKWRKTFEGEPNETRWGSASSLIFYGDQLIVNAIDECGKILSMNKDTGDIKWEFETGSRMAYSIPGLVKTADGQMELVVAVPEKVFGVDADTGEQKWFCKTTLEHEVNAAVLVQDDIAYIYGGYQKVGSLAVRVGGSGDVTDSHVLWESKDTSYVSTPVMKDNHIYWADKSGIAYCVDATTGERKYRSRIPGFGTGRGVKMFGSMVLVGDQIITPSRNSGTFIWKTNPDEFTFVANNKIAGDDSSFNGTPAISGSQIFMRSNKYLYCISE